MIWTAPTGEKYVTHPGSALIFPGLCIPTGPIAPTTPGTERCGDKTAMMPRRRLTRAQNHSAAIDAERRANHQRRTNPTPPHTPDEHIEYLDTFTTANDSDPPPF